MTAWLPVFRMSIRPEPHSYFNRGIRKTEEIMTEDQNTRKSSVTRIATSAVLLLVACTPSEKDTDRETPPAERDAAAKIDQSTGGSIPDPAGAAYTPPPAAPPPPHGNLVKNGSFEGALTYWVRESDCTVQRGAAAHGDYCLAFPKKVRLRSGSIRIEPGSTVTVGIDVRGAENGEVAVTLAPSNRLVARQTKTVWCKDPRFRGTAKTRDGWRRYAWTHRIPALESDGAFPGATSRWWNTTSYVVMIGGKGPLWIDGLSVVVGTHRSARAPHDRIEVLAATDAVSRERYPADACLLQRGDTVDIAARAFNPGDAARTVTLRWELLNYDATLRFGAPVDEEAAIGAGRTAARSKQLQLTGRGLMLARVSAIDGDGRLLGKSDHPLTAPAFPKAATAPHPAERFGGSLRGGPLVAAAQRIGLGWTRWYPHFNWAAIQKKGPDDWDWPDETVEECHNHGIAVTAVLHTLPKWAAGDSAWLPRDMEDWRKDDPRWKDLSIETTWDRFVRKLVGRYGHDGIVYEFANEPEIGTRRWDPDIYYNLTQRTYRLITAVDEKARMQVNATWPGIYGWTEDFISRGGIDAFDIHTFHNYGQGPCTTGETIRTMRNYFASFGGADKEIWFNEGWTYVPTSLDYPASPLTDRTAPGVADMIVRTAVDLFSAGMEKLITFHIGYAGHGKSWWDWVGSGTEWWDDHGNPTVAVGTYNVLCHYLGRSAHVGTVEPADAVIHVFHDARHDRGVAVAWSMAGTAIDLPPDTLRAADLMGNTIPRAGSEPLELPAGGKPVYLVPAGTCAGDDLYAALKPLHDSAAAGPGVHAPPAQHTGPTVDSTAGNPVVVDGAPRWRLDQVWPGDPMKAGNYTPLAWNGKAWAAKEHSHGGQPAAGFRKDGPFLANRTAWGGNPGNKYAALSFIAPADGTYVASTDAVHLKMWEGGPPAYLRVIRFGTDEAGTEVAKIELKKNRADNPLPAVTASLEKGDRLTFIGVFPRMNAAGTFTLKGLTIRKKR